MRQDYGQILIRKEQAKGGHFQVVSDAADFDRSPQTIQYNPD
jgi:hypothetical protein